MQLRRNRIRIGKIHNIFISHTHGDHVFGLYGLLSSYNMMGRSETLNLYAPQAFEPLISQHLSDFDIHLNFELNFVALQGSHPSMIFEDRHITVTSIPLKHRVPCYGFLFREKMKDRNVKKHLIKEYNLGLKEIVALKKGEDLVSKSGAAIKNEELTTDPPEPRSYAYISDTGYLPGLADIIRGVKLLYHEATFADDHMDLAAKTGHSTASQAASIARDAGAERLLIGHFSARYRNVDVLLQEARELFENTIAAEDNLTIAL
jgi:ribonuclease Z